MWAHLQWIFSSSYILQAYMVHLWLAEPVEVENLGDRGLTVNYTQIFDWGVGTPNHTFFKDQLYLILIFHHINFDRQTLGG